MRLIKNLYMMLCIMLLSIGSAMADVSPVNFDGLTDAVDYSTAMAAVLVVFAALASFAILWKGGKKILQALGWS